MKIKTAEFVISNTDYRKCPNGIFPEYAFIGRSNVGKSSLINTLVNRKNLAKISATPGKTRLINHFIINKNWYLVDLPGFGYAKVSKAERNQFNNIIRNYLLNRSNLMCLFMLIDCRHNPQKNDQEFMEWLSEAQVPFVIGFTKCDKLGKNTLNKNIQAYKYEMLKKWEKLPDMFLTSARKKTGVDEISNFIQMLNRKFNESL